MGSEMDFQLDWDLPAYPQLPKMFTNAKAAKKRKHREFVMTDADLEHVVKIPRAATGSAKHQQEATAPAPKKTKAHKAAVSNHENQHTTSAQSEQHEPGDANPSAANKKGSQQLPAGGGGRKEASGHVTALSKAERKKQRRETKQMQQRQQDAQHTTPVAAQAVAALTAAAGGEPDGVSLDTRTQEKKKKKRQKQQQQQEQEQEAAAAAAASADADAAGDAATAAAALPKKSRKNKFKTQEFLQEQEAKLQQQQGKPNPQHNVQQQQQHQQAHSLEQQQQQQDKQANNKQDASKKQRKKDKAAQRQEQQQQQHDRAAERSGSEAAGRAGHAAKGSQPKSPVAAAAVAAAGGGGGGGGSKLLQQFKERLQGSRFRQLNEALYTQPGEESFSTMQQQPELFQQYHEGFQQQVKAWPSQPLDAAIKWLKGKPGDWVVADFGCGEARLAAEATQTVHSLDLVATVPGVIACNMAHTPLDDCSCDVAVFSLALMGTDYGAFLVESSRVLKAGGWLWVAEVRSRFANGSSGKEDFRPLLAALKQLGFQLVQQDTSNRMFVVWVLQKKAAAKQSSVASIKWPPLRACVYKKR